MFGQKESTEGVFYLTANLMLIERKTQLQNSILGGKKLEDRRSLIFPCNFDAMMAVLYSCLLVSVRIARTETKV